MQCPNCQTPLSMTERQGVEIDYCPRCRGVWLDRGELDKIIERSAAYQAEEAAPPAAQQPQFRQAPAPAPPPQYQQPHQQPYQQQHREHYGHHEGYYKQKRKKSFLEELFDD